MASLASPGGLRFANRRTDDFAGGLKTGDPVDGAGKDDVTGATRRWRSCALPGGAAVVSTEDSARTGVPTVSRALATVPGVVIQDFFGGNDQPRIQIRGSGLQQNPVERGVLVLQDGLPINRADGSYVVGLVNPAQAEAIEIYRGYLANRLGATVLGGALNFISPTGRTAPGGKASTSAGSFGQFGATGPIWLGGGRLRCPHPDRYQPA
mgnify:CR=1 FL=1